MFLLTAGHCFAKKKYNSKGEQEPCNEEGPITVTVKSQWPSGLQGTEEIGNTGYFVCNEKADTAEIKIANAFWAVFPELVEWREASKGGNKTWVVEGEAASKDNTKNKRSGALSLSSEGTILSDKGKFGLVTKLVEESATETFEGDSGGPFYIAAPGGGVEVQGTFIGVYEHELKYTGNFKYKADKIYSVPANVIASVKALVESVSKANPVKVNGNTNGARGTIKSVGDDDIILSQAIGSGEEEMSFKAEALFYEPMKQILKVLKESHTGWDHPKQKLFRI